jgi:cell division protein FtsZ
MTFELVDAYTENLRIKVLGIGGGGINILKHVIEKSSSDLEFLAIDTCEQELEKFSEINQLQLKLNNPAPVSSASTHEDVRQAIIDNRKLIEEELIGFDMVFILGTPGGNTGTIAIPVIAELAKQLNILTIAVVTKPFEFVSDDSFSLALSCIAELRQNADAVITIPVEEFGVSEALKNRTPNISSEFKKINDAFIDAVHGIVDLIIREGMINIDFSDLRMVTYKSGYAAISVGHADCDNRAEVATKNALSSPMLKNINPEGATGVLVNITAGLDMSIGEFEDVGNMVKNHVSEDSSVIIGTVIDVEMIDSFKVTLFLFGLDNSNYSINSKVKVDDYSSFNVVVSKDLDSGEISEFLNLLSAIYSDNGGDELIILKGGDGPDLPRLKYDERPKDWVKSHYG